MNPVFGSNKLKLGVFGINGDSNSRTLTPERYQFNWENSLDVAEQGDRLGFEAIVPYARFRSVVDPHHHSGFSFDNFPWSGAIAARTKFSCIMSTVHVTYIHPVVAAKAMATIDHISRGRFGLNIVCGWFKEEAEMMGQQFLGHDDRYAYGHEWIDAVKRLWSEEEEFDIQGRFIRIARGMSQPKPLQHPRPPLMNAGGSPQGQEFASRHCDIALIRTNTFEIMKTEAEAYRRAARDKFGRDLQIWAPCSIIQGDSQQDAERIAQRYLDHPDEPYIEASLGNAAYTRTDSNASQAEFLAIRRKFNLAGNNHLLMGDAASLAEQIEHLSSIGVNGLLLTWVDYQNGVRQFGSEVLPLLERAGLRAPHRGHDDPVAHGAMPVGAQSDLPGSKINLA